MLKYFLQDNLRNDPYTNDYTKQKTYCFENKTIGTQKF